MTVTDYESEDKYISDLYNAEMEYDDSSDEDRDYEPDAEDQFSATTSEEVRERIVSELKEYHEYWLRRAKFLNLTNKITLSHYDCELVRFEVALHFHNFDDAVLAVSKIHSLGEATQSAAYNDLLRSLISKITRARASCSKAAKKIGADTLAKLCLHVYPNATTTDSGRLYLFTRLALINPSTLTTTAANLWSDFLTCVRDFKPEAPSDSQFIITPFDLILLSAVPALVAANFGNLMPAISLDVYRRVLASTLMWSLGKIPEDYFSYKIDNEPASQLAPSTLEICWNNCASFVAVMYWRFSKSIGGQFANRRMLSEILCFNVFGVARPKDGTCEVRNGFSFFQLTGCLLELNKANFNIQNDADLFHLLVFYAVSNISKSQYFANGEDEVPVLAPRHFCDISNYGYVDFWENESIPLDKNGSTILKKYLFMESCPQAEAFSMLMLLDKKFTVLNRFIPLFGELLGDSGQKALRLSSCIMQTHMYHSNYRRALEAFEMHEKLAVDDAERELLELQFLQTCMALERRHTMQKLRAHPGVKSLLRASHFQRCLNIVKRLLRDSPDEIPSDDILSDLLAATENNCYMKIPKTKIRSYAVLCFLQILFCKIQKLHVRIKREDCDEEALSKKVDFLNAFSICTVQLLIDQPVGAPLLEGLIESQTKWGKLDYPRLISYLKFSSIYSHIFSFEDTVKLRITNDVEVWESGAQFFRRVLAGSVSPSTLDDYAKSFLRFIDDNNEAIVDIFKTE